MSIVKTASAHWEGTIKEGKGTISTESKALEQQPYGFNTRFEGKPGTNPEELVGAAHAGCYAMALSKTFTDNDIEAKYIDVSAAVHLEEDGDGFTVTQIDLTLKANVPGLEISQFYDLAKATKEACPISKLMNAAITLDATLEN